MVTSFHRLVLFFRWVSCLKAQPDLQLFLMGCAQALEREKHMPEDLDGGHEGSSELGLVLPPLSTLLLSELEGNANPSAVVEVVQQKSCAVLLCCFGVTASAYWARG